MSVKRVFVPPEAISGDRAEVSGDEFHHLARVRRVRPGVAVELFDGMGRGWRGRVDDVGRRSLTISLDDELTPGEREPRLEIALYQGLPADKGVMEEIVLRATELGAGRITPVITARTRAALLMDTGGLARRLPRWRRIALDGCKSSGRFRPPDIDPPTELAAALAQATAGGLCLVPAEHGRYPPLDASLAAGNPPGPVSLLVGPEGGWAEKELNQALAAGFTPVSLGPRILRTATAALASLVAVQLAFGDMKQRQKSR